MTKLPKKTALDTYLLTKEIPYFRSEPFKLVAEPIWLESEKEWYRDPYVNADKFENYHKYLTGYKKTYNFIFEGLTDPIEKAGLKQKICSKLNEVAQYPNYQYLEYVTDLLEQIESEYTSYKKGLKKVVSDSVQGATKIQPTFFDFIHNVENKEAFAKDLKDTFNIENGANLKIMLELLSEENIITLSDSQLASFHVAMEAYFERGIKSYEAFRKAKNFTTIAKDKINSKLKPLVNKHKA